MTLNDILQSAQGGQAVNNLASQFGLSREEAQAAAQAMIPAFSTGLQSLARKPAAIGAILSELASGAHGASYADSSPAAGASGLAGDVLGQVFGSPQAIDKIAQHVSQVSGVKAQAIEAMLPVVASVLMGGLAHSMASRGLSGVLGELANAAAAPGGLGSALGAAGGGTGSGGRFGSLIGSVFGGYRHAAGAPETAALAAGLTTLSAMFVSGLQVCRRISRRSAPSPSRSRNRRRSERAEGRAPARGVHENALAILA